MAGSIYRLQGTQSRKGNISFSLDTQNATSVGGHRLQTEISSYSRSLGREGGGRGKRGRMGDKEGDWETGRGSVCATSLQPSQTWKGIVG